MNDFGQPEGDFLGHAIGLDYNHSTLHWYGYARYSDLGEDFRADLGFVPQVGYRQPVVGLEHIWPGDPNTWYATFRAGGDWDQTTDPSGNLIEREAEGWINFNASLQSFVSFGGGHRQRGYLDDVFDQGFVNLYAEFQASRALFLAVEGGMSKRIDFAYVDPVDPGAARQGDEIRYEPSIRLEPGSHVRLTLSYEHRQLDLHEDNLFRADLAQSRLVYQINLRTFVRAIVQYGDVRRNLDAYPACVSPTPATPCTLTPRSRDFFTQLLFSYKVNPQTAIFVGYTDTQGGIEDPALGIQDPSLSRQGRTFFFKIGRAWVM